MKSTLRIVAAIAAKDVADALRNKVIASVLLGVVFLMLSSTAMPLLQQLDRTPVVVAYDPGLIEALATRDAVALVPVPSRAALDEAVGEAARVVLGLAVPEAGSVTGGVRVLDGYVPHWAGASDVAAVVAPVEEQLAAAVGQPVRIDVEGHGVYPLPGARGQPFMVASGLALVVLVLGISVVPYLLIDEKEARTFDALRVSPARLGQVVAGKALAGTVYCLAGAAVALAFNARWMVHWELAIPALLLGIAFSVGVGLALGAFFDNPAALGLWASLLAIALLLPAFVGLLNLAGLPDVVEAVLPWLPSVALLRLIQFSLAGDLTGAPIATNAAILAASALAACLLVVWRLRRMDR